MTTTEPTGDFSPMGASGAPLSFEAAIAQTSDLLDQLEQNQLSDAAWGQAIAHLMATEAGARGFFVTYLTDDRPLADHPSDAMLTALGTAPDVVSELLVKNIAMSTAMAIAHRRNQDETLAQGSDRVRSRTTHLLKVLPLPQIADKLAQLHAAALSGQGVYQPFLHRWNYDAEQRQAIADLQTEFQ